VAGVSASSVSNVAFSRSGEKFVCSAPSFPPLAVFFGPGLMWIGLQPQALEACLVAVPQNTCARVLGT
jgi:hypothetical protein